MRLWRESTGLTQEDAAAKLGIAREWLSKIENGKVAVSAEVFLRLQTLKREAGVTSEESQRSARAPSAAVEEEAAAGYGSAELLRREIRELLDKTLSAAGDDVARLGWVREQLLRHSMPPEHWDIHEQVIKKVLADERKAEDASRVQSARAHGKAS